MKILIFYRNLEQGGVQRMMVNLVNYLTKEGHEVTLLLIHQKGKFLELIEPQVPIITFKSKGYISLLPQLIRVLKDNHFNVLFTATPSLNNIAILAKLLSFRSTKVVISERTDPIEEFKGTPFGIYKLSFFLIPVLYRFSNRIVAVSKGVGQTIAKIALINHKKVEVIYNPAYDEKNLLQIQNNVDDNWLNNSSIPVIIAAGRLTNQKNFDLLIRAFKILNSRRNARLLILGEGELKEELTHLVKSLDIVDSVRFAGFQMHPISWISKAKVFVLSSLWEGFGNVLIDALTAQATIVSTNCKSGPIEILDYGKYGYMVNSFDEKEMADVIEKAIDSPIPKDLLLQRARMFSQKEIGTKYIKLFKELEQ
jgi:glycosyltransferase involved in cell wall biosynthesis